MLCLKKWALNWIMILPGIYIRQYAPILGCFKYSNVTPKTMRTAANLLEYDFDHAEVARLLFDSESLAAAK